MHSDSASLPAVSGMPTPELCPENSLDVPLWLPWLLVLWGTICFAPGLLWHPSNQVQLGFMLVVSSPRAEQLWAHMGAQWCLYKKWPQWKQPTWRVVATDPLEISKGITEHQPDSHEDPFCRQHMGLDGCFALEQLPLGGDRLTTAASSARWFLVPVEFYKENQYVEFAVVTAFANIQKVQCFRSHAKSQISTFIPFAV